MVDFVEICRQETDIAFPPLEPELTQSFDHNEDIRSIYGMFLQPLVPNTILVLKVIYSKHSKHWPYTVAHTIDCVCSKMLNHGLNHGFSLALFNLIPCPIHTLNCICVSLSKFRI